MDSCFEAQELLIHYMKQAGVPMTDDTRAELRRLVEKIVDAARVPETPTKETKTMAVIGGVVFPDQGDEEACKAWEATICVRALGSRVLAVARTRIEGTWMAYCDAVAGENHDREWEKVLDQGCPLGPDVARGIFPLFNQIPYAK